MTDKSFGDYSNRSTVKNPLLSTAVVGLSIEDLTHNAVLLPVVQNVEVMASQDKHTEPQHRPERDTRTNLPSGDSNANLTTPPIKADQAKPKDDFDVNEYFERLHSTRYVSGGKLDALPPEENLEEINLNEAEEPQQSLTADIAQNFSQLPQVLPQVASAVFGSFSSMLSLRSREQTPDAPEPKAEERTAAALSMVEAPPPLREPPVGGTSNTFRITTKKKAYAQIPGLSSHDAGGIQMPSPFNMPPPPPTAHAVSYFNPNMAAQANTYSIPGNENQDVPPVVGIASNISGTSTQQPYEFYHQVDNKLSIAEATRETEHRTNVPQFYSPHIQEEVHKAEHQDLQSLVQVNEQNTILANVFNPYAAADDSKVQNAITRNPNDMPQIQNAPTYFTPSAISQKIDSVDMIPPLQTSNTQASHSDFQSSSAVPPITTPQNTGIPIVPPPPMFSNTAGRDGHSDAGKSILPPSVARRIAGKQTMFKAPIVPANIFVPPEPRELHVAAPVISDQKLVASEILPPPTFFNPANVITSSEPLQQQPSTTSINSKNTGSQNPPGLIFENEDIPSVLEPQPPPFDPVKFLQEQPPPEPPKPVPEPPKISSGNLNYRMTKKRPQYYSGPIEGVGSISNNVKPVLGPVETTNAYQGALFTPDLISQHQSVVPDNNMYQFNLLPAPSTELSTVPFDLSRPEEVAMPSVYANVEPNKQSIPHNPYHTAFDFSRQTVEYEQPKEESKGFGLIGSLKSKLSAININKIQDTVTTFFDPAFNESSNQDTSNQGHQEISSFKHYTPGGQTESNLEIFVPNAEYIAQYQYNPQTYDPTAHGAAAGSQYYYTPNSYYQNPPSDVSYHQIDSSATSNISASYPPILPKNQYSGSQSAVTNELQDSIQQSSQNIQMFQNVSTSQAFAFNPPPSHPEAKDTNEVRETAAASNLDATPYGFVTPDDESFRKNHYSGSHSSVTNELQDSIQQSSQNLHMFQNISTSQTFAFNPSSSQLEAKDTNEARGTKPSPILDATPYGFITPDDETVPDNYYSGSHSTVTNELQHSIQQSSQNIHMFQNVSTSQTFAFNFSPNQSEAKYTNTQPNLDATPYGFITPEDESKTFFKITEPRSDGGVSFFSTRQNANASSTQNYPAGAQKYQNQNKFDNEKEPQMVNVSFHELSIKNDDTANNDIPHNFKGLDYESIGSDTLNKTSASTSMHGLSQELADRSKEMTDLDGKMNELKFEKNKNDLEDLEESFIPSPSSFFDDIKQSIDLAEERIIEKAESHSDLNICETCREVEDRPKEKGNVTAQLIENITSPIQLSNPVEVPFTDRSNLTSNRPKFGDSQYAETSHVTEETIEAIESASELLDERHINKLKKSSSKSTSVEGINYGWTSNTNLPVEVALDHTYDFQPDPNAIGFFSKNSLFFDNIPTNISDEIKAEFINPHEESPVVVLPNETSFPSAPPAVDLYETGKSDVTGGLDVQLIEQDASKDYSLFEEFVIEPSETDDDMIEYKKLERASDESVPEIDSFTNRIEKFKQCESTTDLTRNSDVLINQAQKSDSIPISTSPAITIASYFDTGNYAAETHYRNSLTSPSSIQLCGVSPPNQSSSVMSASVFPSYILTSFSQQDCPTPPVVKQAIEQVIDEPIFKVIPQSYTTEVIPIPKIPDTTTQTRPMNTVTFSAEQSILMAEEIAIGAIPDEFISKVMPVKDVEQSKLPELASLLCSKIPDDIVEDVRKLPTTVIESEPAAASALYLPSAQHSSLPDPLNFFTSSNESNAEQSNKTENTDNGFSRLASYFSSPAKNTDHSKSFFELSQGQDHRRKNPETNKDIDHINNNNKPKPFFDLCQGQNHYIESASKNEDSSIIPDSKYEENLNLIKDLSTYHSDNFVPSIEQTIRTLNYFTVEYDDSRLVSTLKADRKIGEPCSSRSLNEPALHRQNDNFDAPNEVPPKKKAEINESSSDIKTGRIFKINLNDRRNNDADLTTKLPFRIKIIENEANTNNSSIITIDKALDKSHNTTLESTVSCISEEMLIRTLNYEYNKAIIDSDAKEVVSSSCDSSYTTANDYFMNLNNYSSERTSDDSVNYKPAYDDVYNKDENLIRTVNYENSAVASVNTFNLKDLSDKRVNKLPLKVTMTIKEPKTFRPDANIFNYNDEQIIRMIYYYNSKSFLKAPTFNAHVPQITKNVNVQQQLTNEEPKEINSNNELDSIIINCKYCCQYYPYNDLNKQNYAVTNNRVTFKVAMDSEGKEVNSSNKDAQRSPTKEVTSGRPNNASFNLNLNEEDKEDIAILNDNRSLVEYEPVKHHWYYRVDFEGKSIWRGFSTADTTKLEEAFNSPDLNENTLVATDGGRFDVNIIGRLRVAVYWSEKPTNVRRCSWFYKGTTDARYVPYSESVAEKLEEEYRHGITTHQWHRRVVLSSSEAVVLHGPAVMVHLPHSPTSADAWPPHAMVAEVFSKRVYRNPPKITVAKNQADKIDHLLFLVHGAGEWRSQKQKIQSNLRPRVVRRGADDIEIEDIEPSTIDHLLLLCHGVGSACDMRFRSVEEVVDDFRSTSLQLIQGHYKNSYDNGDVGRIEVLPISWHSTLHTGTGGVDARLARVTLDSIPRLRAFTNDAVLDALFYTSPTYCQIIIECVCSEINRLYSLFKSRNPGFSGSVSLGGHSLGSVILYDILCHQPPMAPPSGQAPPSAQAPPPGHAPPPSQAASADDVSARKAYIPGSVSAGLASIRYPVLDFKPKALYAMGSPIAIFECIRGVDSLGKNFALPTCERFFNIFHPYDPIAYRIEPLINPQLKAVPPSLIPHHKGRKRMHLELKETMARVGADIKQKVIESIKSTWSSMWRTQPPSNETLEKVVEEEIEKEALAEEAEKEAQPDIEVNTSDLGKLNGGRRVDYVLQEAPFEMINEYLFAMSSHVGYWESEDTMLLILREIYDSLGVQPDCTVPPLSMTVQRTRTVAANDQGIYSTTDSPSTSSAGT